MEEFEELAAEFEECLENGNLKRAQTLIDKFPKSQRRNRLEAKIFEARGEYDKAMDIYSQDTSPQAIKQMAMCLYGKGDWEEGIEALLKYLDTWMGI
jgi:tetratricopeptide (TPR) repeat protein